MDNTASNGLSPDIIYHNGTVITLDDSNPKAEAVAVIGDRIAATGDNTFIRQMAGSTTKVIDLEGKTMTPGFIEPHVHSLMYPMYFIQAVNILCKPHGSIDTMQGLIEALKEKAAVTPKGDWITGSRYDDLGMAEKRHPTRYDLDKVSTDHPVHVWHRSGHIGACNSKALEMAGINGKTPDPPGGTYERDPETNEPNGVLAYSPAMQSVRKLIPNPSLEQRLEMLPQVFLEFNKVGITSCHEAGVGIFGTEDIVLFQEARRRGSLTVRTNMMMWPPTIFNEKGQSIGFQTGFGDEWLRIGPVKMLVDGSVPGFTGWLTKPYHTPYHGNSAHKGKSAVPLEKFNAAFINAHCNGYQVAAHAGGDAAIDAFIAAVRMAQEKCPRPDARHRIEHCHVVRDDQLETMAELGITPSFFVRHTHYWGDRYMEIVLGPERAAKIDPLKTALDKGVRFTIHSDLPHVMVNPLMDMYAAVNRITAEGKSIGPAERVSPEQALRAMTKDAAWQGFEEALKGTIEKGKLADFVILAENPTTVDPERIKDIKVEETIVGAKTVYKA
jgi:predicted amidohydrolase YtcJ